MDETSLCLGLRVVECSTAIGTAYAGWLLARMGAELVRLSWDAGDALPALCDRRQPAFARRFAHLDSGKSSLDIAAGATDMLYRVVAECDVLLLDEVLSFEHAFGVTLDALRGRYPYLIIGVAHLLPPMTGAAAPATGLDAQAIGGILWAVGDPEREPLPFPPGVLDHQSGCNLAAAVLLALIGRQRHGQGDCAEVSLAQVLSYYACCNALGQLPWGMKWQRAGARCFGSGGAYPYTLLPCKDGFVCLICRARDEWGRLVAAMGNPAWTKEPRYQDLRAMGTQYPQEVDDLIRPWLAQKTRAELLAISMEYSIPMAPVRAIDELLATPQFASRGALEILDLPSGEAAAPGLCFHAGADHKMDEIRTRRRFAAGGTAFVGWTQTRASLPSASTDACNAAQPLAGLRVLDLGWVWSAPLVSGILSEFGAEVIKVEHAGRLDNVRLRGRPRHADGTPVEGPPTELSPSFHQINHNKRGVTLDLKKPEGLALLKQLAARCDVVIENMSPGAAMRAGFGYEVLAQENPRLVMVSLSAAGQFGPGAAMRAYAPVMSSFIGLEGLIGYAGETPIGAMNVGLGDPNAAVHALVAIMAALWQRHQSGRGCYVDLSQVESLLCGLGGAIIDASLGAPQPRPAGGSHPEMAPHGVYPAAGEDRWLTLAVGDDAQWRALCAAMGPEGQRLSECYPSRAARLAQHRDLDAAIAAWTGDKDRDSLCLRLRQAGIAASPVLDIHEVRRDPVFLWRDTLREVTHPITGAESIMVAPWRFDSIRASITSSSPLLGEHNEQILCGLAGETAQSLRKLVEDGVVR